MNDVTKKRLFIIGGIVLVIAIIFAIIGATNREPEETYIDRAAEVRVDQDTGELITDDPNLTDQSVEKGAVLILGLEELSRLEILGSQIAVIKDEIQKFASERLDGKYESITIRPQDIVAEDSVTETTIRLGQSDILLPVIFTARQTGETRVEIFDPNNQVGGNYDSGETVIYGE